MKLAEALTHRADCQRKLAQLKDRMIRNAKVQEGEQPAEDPFELLGSYQGKVEEFDRSLQSIFDYMGMDYVNQEIEKAKAKLQKNYGSTLFSDYGYNLKEYTELMAYLIEEGQNVHLKSPGDWETSHSTII